MSVAVFDPSTVPVRGTATVIAAFINSERLQKPLWKKLMLGVSISYIITIIATGFQLF